MSHDPRPNRLLIFACPHKTDSETSHIKRRQLSIFQEEQSEYLQLAKSVVHNRSFTHHTPDLQCTKSQSSALLGIEKRTT